MSEPSFPNTRSTFATDRLSGIQLLRAAAALLIVLYHSGNGITGFADKGYHVVLPFIYDRGFLAVDLFFAISGFIICHVFDNARFSVPSFYFRRFWRIYPIYALFCLAAVLWFRAGLPQLGDNPGWDNIIKSVLILPQVHFPIYAVGWTLEHEIIFYVLAGLLLPYAGKWGLFAVLVLLAAIGWSGVLGKTWDYHLFAPPQLQFAAGVLAYLAHHRLPKGVPWWPLVCTGCVLYVLPGTSVFNLDNYRAVVALGSFLLILGWLRFDFGNYPSFERLAVHFGNLTYSTYLVHWIVFPVFGIAAAAVSLPWLIEPYRFSAIGVVFLTSHFFHISIEKPTLRLGRAIEAQLYRSARTV